MVELALVFLPLMALTLAIVDFAMPIFLHGTFMTAVREGCRFGITYQTSYNGVSYGTQTGAIKAVVQANAMGFLSSAAASNLIFVRYFSPVSPFGQVTGAGANASGNILQVSVEGYNWSWIAPIWRTTTPLSVTAITSDRLEVLPPGATAPAP